MPKSMCFPVLAALSLAVATVAVAQTTVQSTAPWDYEASAAR